MYVSNFEGTDIGKISNFCHDWDRGPINIHVNGVGTQSRRLHKYRQLHIDHIQGRIQEGPVGGNCDLEAGVLIDVKNVGLKNKKR